MIEVKGKELRKLNIDKKIIEELEKAEKPAVKEIDANTKATLALAEAINALAAKDSSTANKEMMAIIESIINIQKTQDGVIAVLEKSTKPKEWVFSVERDSNNKMTKIIAKEA